MSSNKNPNSRGSRGAGAVKGRNSNNPSPNPARDSSRRPTTSSLDTTPATHDAGSPRNPEGDNIDTPVAPPLEVTDTQDNEQQPTAIDSVEQLVIKLTVPIPPPATVDGSSHAAPSLTPCRRSVAKGSGLVLLAPAWGEWSSGTVFGLVRKGLCYWLTG